MKNEEHANPIMFEMVGAILPRREDLPERGRVASRRETDHWEAPFGVHLTRLAGRESSDSDAGSFGRC